MNDTIYRRDAIQALVDTEEIKGFDYRMLEDRLMEIPSADKQQVDGATLISAMTLGYSYGIKANRPQGEWIDKGWKGDWQFETDGRGNCWHEYECSECGFHNKGGKSNYCPHCGAYMKEVDDETD